MEFRMAEAKHLELIIAMLADDALGAVREQPGLDQMQAYRAAFEEIGADPNTLRQRHENRKSNQFGVQW